jgi:hypothetical protein
MENRLSNSNLLVKLNIPKDKKVLCYFPTWDEDSSIVRFADVIEQLREEYYIITKPHHCTFRLLEKRNELDLLYSISDVVLDGNYDFESVANIGDVRICDAKSGSALESLFINDQIVTIFLSEHQNINDYFYPEIYDVADAIIYEPREMLQVIKNLTVKRDICLDKYIDRSMNEERLRGVLNTIVKQVKKERVSSYE